MLQRDLLSLLLQFIKRVQSGEKGHDDLAFSLSSDLTFHLKINLKAPIGYYCISEFISVDHRDCF